MNRQETLLERGLGNSGKRAAAHEVAAGTGARRRLATAFRQLGPDYIPRYFVGYTFRHSLGSGWPRRVFQRASSTLEMAERAYCTGGEGGDSNPRYACAYSAFRVRRDRPLCHLSGAVREIEKLAKPGRGALSTTDLRPQGVCHLLPGRSHFKTGSRAARGRLRPSLLSSACLGASLSRRPSA